MSPLRNQSGQFIVESILIMTVLLGATIYTISYFKDNSLLAQVVSAPWKNLAGMLQNGQWAPAAASMQMHPSNHSRHSSREGVPAP